jgi:hypothetical protein
VFLSLRAEIVPYFPAIHMEAQYSNLDRRFFPENVPNVLAPLRVSADTDLEKINRAALNFLLAG